MTVVDQPVYAMVSGKPLTMVPADLFIPPDALEVLLDSFSGPLDLLLYLIRRQNLDILDIPIAHITRQYMQYIQLMEAHRLELAADYLLMAAMLAEIKSRLLLPVPAATEEEAEEDPRMALVRKLQAYEQMKLAAERLEDLPRSERDVFRVAVQLPPFEKIVVHPDVDLLNLSQLMHELIKQQGHQVHHQIARETLSVQERMASVLNLLLHQSTLSLHQLFTPAEGRLGVVVSVLAILELAKQSLLRISQTGAYAPVYIMAVDHG